MKQVYLKAAECLKVLANPHRLMLVDLLSKEGASVGVLAKACNLKPHVASEHLNLMKRCGFLTSRKEGRVVEYEIAEDHLRELLACMHKRF